VIANTRTNDLLARHTPAPDALTAGFQRALTACAIFLGAAALIALKATNTKGAPASDAVPLDAVAAPDSA
jgi:hypothetical protein